VTLLLVINLGFGWSGVAGPTLTADICDTFFVSADVGFTVTADSGFSVPADSGFSVLADPPDFSVPGCGS
jgi:hypothetical protein